MGVVKRRAFVGRGARYLWATWTSRAPVGCHLSARILLAATDRPLARAREPAVRRPAGRVRRFCYYRGPVSGPQVPGGVVHELPHDLCEVLVANATALDAWKDITPLARNEFICWVEDAKQQTTRERRIRRTKEELEEGQRRPCCWPGCKHRERTGR